MCSFVEHHVTRRQHCFLTLITTHDLTPTDDGQWFLTYRSCFVNSCSLVGSLLFNPINAWLLGSFNFRIAFRCAAAIVLGTGVACCWNFSSREGVTSHQLGDEFDVETDDEATYSVNAASVVTATDTGTAGLRSADGLGRRCTLAEVRQRPEIVLWYLGNGLSYLGFYMPFVNLVS